MSNPSNVRSRNYFEQMKGRGTRTLDYENLHAVSPLVTERKTGFVIVDAVGVTKSLETDSRPLERKPNVSMHDLMMSVVLGAKDDDTLTSLANRVIKLNKVLTPKEQAKAEELCEKPLIQVARDLLDAFDEDVQEAKAREHFSLADNVEPTEEQLDTVQELLADAAVSPFFKPEVRDFLENARKNHDQIIDHTNIDKLEFAGWDTDQEEKAEKAIQTFRRFIEDNKDEIEALKIIYSQSYKQRPLTLKMVKELYEVLQKPPYRLTNEMLWSAYVIRRGDKVKDKSVVNKLADIISLIRFELGYNQELNVFSAEIALKFQSWIFAKNAGYIHFTEEQMEWLRDIRDHVAVSMEITKEDLEYAPFDNKGGLGRFYDLFGDGYKELLEEINHALVA